MLRSIPPVYPTANGIYRIRKRRLKFKVAASERHHSEAFVAVPSALMRSPHHLHSVFDVAPLSGFFAVARLLASLGILGRLGDSLEAVLLEHLTRDHVNLYLRYHVALLMFHPAPNRRDRCLSAARSKCR